MSYLVLARKWRPQNFEELIGQAPVARTLQNAIASGRIGHGFLFTGPRGVGKTSTARILAKALNCVKGPTPHPCGECDSCKEVAGQGSVDVLEIDGASNNSVEDIRNLRERVLYGGVRDRYKIYIIDEVHMLTGPAFNALLKTLEEPPSHVIFIFATTEVQKIPATILSRTQRFDFRRIAGRDLAAQLKKIMDAEKIPCTPEAMALVARAAAGSLRDAQTLLDQVISFVGQEAGGKPNPVGVDDVLQVLGGVDESQAVLALKAALSGELEPALTWVKDLYEKGGDLRLALASLNDCLRGLLMVKSSAQPAEHCDLLPETLQTLAGFSKEIGLARVMGLLKAAAETETQLRYATNPRLALESLFIRFSPGAPGNTLGELFDQLSLMEERLRQAPQNVAVMPEAVKVEAPKPVAKIPVPVPTPAAVLEPVVHLTPNPSPQERGDAGTPVLAVEQIEETKAAGPFGLEAVKLEWEKVAEKAHELSVMLGSSVRDVEIASADDKSVKVVVRNAMQKETLDSAEHRAQLEGVFKEVFGRELSLKVSYTPPAGAAKPKTKGGLTQEEIEKATTPEVKRLQELFDAEIVEIKKI